MFNKGIINNFFNIGIEIWLKSICTSIDIQNLRLNLNKNCFGKVDEIYLEAKNLIYKGLFINKIIIKTNDFNLKFNYRNHLIYSEDLSINCFLTIDKKNLENTFFSNKLDRLRIKIEKAFLKGQVASKLIINNDLITFYYDKNKINKEVSLSLNLKGNLIFLDNINNKNKIFLPLDKNIKINNCYIKNELINVDLTSKIIFDN